MLRVQVMLRTLIFLGQKISQNSPDILLIMISYGQLRERFQVSELWLKKANRSAQVWPHTRLKFVFEGSKRITKESWSPLVPFAQARLICTYFCFFFRNIFAGYLWHLPIFFEFLKFVILQLSRAIAIYWVWKFQNEFWKEKLWVVLSWYTKMTNDLWCQTS